MKGESAVFTAFSTAARVTLPRASRTSSGADTSVGSIPTSVWPAARGPLPKKARPVSQPASQRHRAVDEADRPELPARLPEHDLHGPGIERQADDQHQKGKKRADAGLQRDANGRHQQAESGRENNQKQQVVLDEAKDFPHVSRRAPDARSGSLHHDLHGGSSRGCSGPRSPCSLRWCLGRIVSASAPVPAAGPGAARCGP